MNRRSAIPGFPGYAATCDGHIVSMRRAPPYVVPGSFNAQGYRCVVVGSRSDGSRKKYPVHQLVALAFMGARPEGQEVRHLNDIKTDNRVENLAYGTRHENRQDAIRNGRIKKGTEHHSSVIDVDRVALIQAGRAAGLSAFRIGSALRISDVTVGKVLSGNHWSARFSGVEDLL